MRVEVINKRSKFHGMVGTYEPIKGTKNPRRCAVTFDSGECIIMSVSSVARVTGSRKSVPKQKHKSIGIVVDYKHPHFGRRVHVDKFDEEKGIFHVRLYESNPQFTLRQNQITDFIEDKKYSSMSCSNRIICEYIGPDPKIPRMLAVSYACSFINLANLPNISAHSISDGSVHTVDRADLSVYESLKFSGDDVKHDTIPLESFHQISDVNHWAYGASVFKYNGSCFVIENGVYCKVNINDSQMRVKSTKQEAVFKPYRLFITASATRFRGLYLYQDFESPEEAKRFVYALGNGEKVSIKSSPRVWYKVTKKCLGGFIYQLAHAKNRSAIVYTGVEPDTVKTETKAPMIVVGGDLYGHSVAVVEVVGDLATVTLNARYKKKEYTIPVSWLVPASEVKFIDVEGFVQGCLQPIVGKTIVGNFLQQQKVLSSGMWQDVTRISYA